MEDAYVCKKLRCAEEELNFPPKLMFCFVRPKKKVLLTKVKTLAVTDVLLESGESDDVLLMLTA